MCGRLVMAVSAVRFRKDFADYLVAEDIPEPSWNVAPTNDIAILVEDHKRPGVLRAERARWSLTPPSSATLAVTFPTFNARSETVTEKALWKTPFHSRRCAIVATGFYEWTGPKEARQPHFIAGADNTLLMAGLYGWWREPGVEGRAAWHLTATMLTQSSTGVMAPIHHRMPVFLSRRMLAGWLDPLTHGSRDLMTTVTAESESIADSLHAYPVAQLVGDGPELLTPLASKLSTLEDRGQ